MDHDGDGFQAWVDSLRAHDRETGGDAGRPTPGADELLRELYDAHGGPVPPGELRRAGADREDTLAAHAVQLFTADLHRTTSLRPVIEVWRDPDSGGLIISYYGNYTAPAFSAMREPEAVCEVADNLRDHVVEDLWSVWPLCPSDGHALDARPVDHQAMWWCRTGDHPVSTIGELRTSQVR